MKRLAVLGASGHGKVVAEIAELTGWSEIVFFDDDFPRVSALENWSVKGTTEDLVYSAGEFDGCIVAIGDNTIRSEKSSLLQSKLDNLTSLIHPSAIVSSYSRIGPGSVLMAGAVINPFVQIGQACIVNTAATVDHDCVLGDGVHLSPGVSLGGGTLIGKNSWIGIGASVRQSISIGENVTVGAGAAVVSNLPDNSVAFGVPARVRKNKLKNS